MAKPKKRKVRFKLTNAKRERQRGRRGVGRHGVVTAADRDPGHQRMSRCGG